MLRTFRRHGQDCVCQRSLCCGKVFPRTAVGLDDPARQLPGLCRAKHDGVAFHSYAQAVVLNDAVGIGVIGGDGRFQPVFSGFEYALPLRPIQGMKLLANACGQFPGRFPGERDPKDLLRPHQSIGHQPHDAVGHGLGLS